MAASLFLKLAASSKWGEQISFGDLIMLTNDRTVPAAVKEKDNFILYHELLCEDEVWMCEGIGLGKATGT